MSKTATVKMLVLSVLISNAFTLTIVSRWNSIVDNNNVKRVLVEKEARDKKDRGMMEWIYEERDIFNLNIGTLAKAKDRLSGELDELKIQIEKQSAEIKLLTGYTRDDNENIFILRDLMLDLHTPKKKDSNKTVFKETLF